MVLGTIGSLLESTEERNAHDIAGITERNAPEGIESPTETAINSSDKWVTDEKTGEKATRLVSYIYSDSHYLDIVNRSFHEMLFEARLTFNYVDYHDSDQSYLRLVLKNGETPICSSNHLFSDISIRLDSESTKISNNDYYYDSGDQVLKLNNAKKLLEKMKNSQSLFIKVFCYPKVDYMDLNINARSWYFNVEGVPFGSYYHDVMQSLAVND